MFKFVLGTIVGIVIAPTAQPYIVRGLDSLIERIDRRMEEADQRRQR